MKAAVIGTGYMGKVHAAVLKERADTFILCSADTTGGKALAEQYNCNFYSDYREMFEREKPDFVSVCLPTHLHYEAVMEALKCGIHVLCEKPFASTPKQAHEMMDLAEEKGLTLMVGHCVRFAREYEYVRRCISDKRFGRLLSLELYRHSAVPGWSVGNWLTDFAHSGGALKDLHIHDTDMIIHLLGMPKSVNTTGSATSCRTIFRYEEEMAVTASGSWRNANTYPFTVGYDAVFENAVVTYNGDEVILYEGSDKRNPLEQEVFPDFLQQDNVYYNEINYFCSCLAGHKKPEWCLPLDSLNTLIVNGMEADSLESRKECLVKEYIVK